MSSEQRRGSRTSSRAGIAGRLPRLPRIITLPLGALLGLFLGLGIFDRVIMPAVVRQGDEVRIPAVGGRPIAEARQMLDRVGLESEVSPGRFHRGVPAGAVLEVSPPVGLSVKKGRRVFLTPSLGETQTSVPNLLGHTLRMARLIAGDAGLRIGPVAYAASDLARPDQVLAMSPEPGAPSAPEGEITLLLSRARAPVPDWMPNFIGQPSGQASAILRRSGYHATIEELPGGQPGAVVQQDPAPGAPLWPRSHIRLMVSPGRPSRYERGIG